MLMTIAATHTPSVDCIIFFISLASPSKFYFCSVEEIHVQVCEGQPMKNIRWNFIQVPTNCNDGDLLELLLLYINGATFLFVSGR